MPAETLISVEEYLATSYRPDCDYVDGQVLERNLGEWEHGSLQALKLGFSLQGGNNGASRSQRGSVFK